MEEDNHNRSCENARHDNEVVGNSPSVSQSPTLDRKDKVKHYIRIKTHNNIALRFWCKIGVKGLICARLMSYNHVCHIEPQSLNNHDYNHNSYMKKYT